MRQERGDETRTRIVEAGRELFSNSGYDAAGVAEICARAGVSKGAFLELLEEWRAGLNDQLEKIRQEATTFQDRLVGMARLIEPILQVSTGRLPLFLEFWRQASRDPEIREATLAPYQHYHDFFANLVRHGIDEGTLQEVDADIAGYVVLSLALGLVLQGLVNPEGADWKGVAQEGMRILSEGLHSTPS
jgi:AcrR family transcriptional regulator